MISTSNAIRLGNSHTDMTYIQNDVLISNSSFCFEFVIISMFSCAFYFVFFYLISRSSLILLCGLLSGVGGNDSQISTSSRLLNDATCIDWRVAACLKII